MGVDGGRSCHRHLRRDRPLTLKLELVPLERLLPTALEVLALVVFRHAVLQRGEDRGKEIRRVSGSSHAR